MRIRTSPRIPVHAPVRALTAGAAMSLMLATACSPEAESEEGIVTEAPYEEPEAVGATDVTGPAAGVDEEAFDTDDMDAADTETGTD